MPHLEMIIPDEDKLFYHISIKLFQPDYNFNDIPPHAFTPKGDGNLSVNWERYCRTPKDCLSQVSERFPDGRTSETHGVGHFIAGDIRKVESLDLSYSPFPDNIAHSNIVNIPPKKPKAPYNEIRKKLKRVFKFWDIKPEL